MFSPNSIESGLHQAVVYVDGKELQGVQGMLFEDRSLPILSFQKSAQIARAQGFRAPNVVLNANSIG
jgi:hypothetical protein